MLQRKELFSHREKIWVLCLDRSAASEPLPVTMELVDWYNNQILTKSLVGGKIETAFGKSTLLATTGLLPVSRLLVVGLGDLPDLNAAAARKFAQDLDQIVMNLGEAGPWILFPDETPAKFTDEFEKSRTSFESLAHAKISIGNS